MRQNYRDGEQISGCQKLGIWGWEGGDKCDYKLVAQRTYL